MVNETHSDEFDAISGIKDYDFDDNDVDEYEIDEKLLRIRPSGS